MTFLDNKSRSTRRSPAISKIASPTIKTQVAKICTNDDRTFIKRTREESSACEARGSCTLLINFGRHGWLHV